jgi:hypothetical protein
MKNRLVFCLFLACVCITNTAFGAKIRGRITTADGSFLPFATLYVKNTNLGTTSNEEGDYALELPNGKHELVFQYVGYKPKNYNITIEGEDILLDVALEAEAFTLKEVVITAQDQDPAYAIIRAAQAKRRFYLKEEIKSYQCRAYVKGLQRLNKKPKTFMGQNIPIDTGVVYFSESISEIDFQQPNTYKEKMISSKVSGNSKAFSFNQASQAWLNLYQNISGEDMTERGVVSPIASNAMGYYRYRLIGAFYQDGVLVNKIQVIPRRKSAPAYSGHIYIIEGSWRVHSADLWIRKGQIEFVDSARVIQVYAPMKDSEVWFPLSQKINFEFKAFGFAGKGYFVFIYSNPVVEPAFPKKNFTPEVFVVEKEANKRDSIYWKSIRPIPLTPEEVKEYRQKDSIEVIKESKPFKDSLDKKNNKFRISNLLLGGYTYRNSFRKTSYNFQPLLNIIQYNTVEGVALDWTLGFNKAYEERRNLSITPSFRYGFSNRRFQAKIAGTYVFNRLNNNFLTIEGGKYVEQLSRAVSISPFTNSLYTLWNEENFLKIYEKSYGRIAYGQRLVNGVRFFSTLEYAQRTPLENTNDYKWRDIKGREFTSNAPILDNDLSTAFSRHNALLWSVVFTFNFGQKYAVYPDIKFATETPYPTVRLNYRKGINALGSDVNYDFLMLNINDDLNFGLVGTSEWEFEAGKFLNNKQMTFVDYRHFTGNQTLFMRQNLSSFHLLDYYRFSTDEHYIKGHYEHHLNGLIFNAIPLLKKLKLQEVIGANYLYTPVLGHYFEFGVGIEHILKVLRVDFITSYRTEGSQVNTGLRFGFGF